MLFLRSLLTGRKYKWSKAAGTGHENSNPAVVLLRVSRSVYFLLASWKKRPIRRSLQVDLECRLFVWWLQEETLGSRIVFVVKIVTTTASKVFTVILATTLLLCQEDTVIGTLSKIMGTCHFDKSHLSSTIFKFGFYDFQISASPNPIIHASILNFAWLEFHFLIWLTHRLSCNKCELCTAL